jgi:hypothetical protein
MFFTRFAFISIISIFMATSCTLSFTNIASDGQASDMVDEEQKADGRADAVLDIPSTTL